MGVQPIAAPSTIINNLLHLPPATSEIIDVGNARELNLEQLASIKPDLILSIKAFTNADAYPLLSRIAPTVVFDVDDYAEWQRITRLCGEVLSKEAEVDKLEADYEAKLQAFKAALSKDPSQIQVSVAYVNLDQILAMGKNSFTGTVLEAAGLARPPKQAEGAILQISIELLDDIDGDVLFVLKPQSQTEAAEDISTALEQMKNNALWAQLKAVQEQRVYEVDTHWFGAGYIAANLILDDLLTYIAKSE